MTLVLLFDNGTLVLNSETAIIDLHPLLCLGRYTGQESAMLQSRQPPIHSSLDHSCINIHVSEAAHAWMMVSGVCVGELCVPGRVNTPSIRCEKAHIIKFPSLSSHFFPPFISIFPTTSRLRNYNVRTSRLARRAMNMQLCGCTDGGCNPRHMRSTWRVTHISIIVLCEKHWRTLYRSTKTL